MLKDQLEKQQIISKNKNPNFKNVSFKNLLDGKSIKVFNEIRYQNEITDYSQLIFIGSSKKYAFKFGNFVSLGNIYNDNISSDTAKQKQRQMENMLESFIDYNLIKDVYKNEKVNTLLNAREFYKGQREILIAFEKNMFPLPKLYVFGEN